MQVGQRGGASGRGGPAPPITRRRTRPPCARLPRCHVRPRRGEAGPDPLRGNGGAQRAAGRSGGRNGRCPAGRGLGTGTATAPSGAGQEEDGG